MPETTPAASVIVPTYREARNMAALAGRVFETARSAGIDLELIIVDDDSQDGTEQIVEELAREMPIRLVVRHENRGLSQAVLAGFAAARAPRFVVMDADLQHPPERIPALLACLDEPGCDFVIATRYGRGGSLPEGWGLIRRWASRVAGLLARPLGPLTDPMSGFFAIPRSVWQRARRLNPIGYKIALEIYVKAGCRCPREVPIRFDLRAAGESKFSLREQVRYLRHLMRLYRFRFPVMSVVVAVGALAALVWVGVWLAV